MNQNWARFPAVFLAFLLAWTSSVAADPTLGAHVLGFQWNSDSSPALSTSPINTQSSGSTVVISVGRGVVSGNNIPPRDNFSNTFTQIGVSHTYTNWPSSGTALYTKTALSGGSGHIFSAQTGAEVTLMAVEVMNGGKIQDFKWNEVLKGQPLTSLSVTTTGPATLIAFWWGDDGSGPHTATANNNFVVRDSIFLAGSLVQGAVATREVTIAGTYNVTWSATPTQGAQLWLVAVQSSEASPEAPKNLRASP